MMFWNVLAFVLQWAPAVVRQQPVQIHLSSILFVDESLNAAIMMMQINF